MFKPFYSDYEYDTCSVLTLLIGVRSNAALVVTV